MSDVENSPCAPKPALLISRSMWIFFSRVKARISSGAAGSARSATKISARILRVVERTLARSSRRSRRRAVRTRFVPPAANSSARALPMPALAPVTRAHFPCHFAMDFPKLRVSLLSKVLCGAVVLKGLGQAGRSSDALLQRERTRRRLSWLRGARRLRRRYGRGRTSRCWRCLGRSR